MRGGWRGAGVASKLSRTGGGLVTHGPLRCNSIGLCVCTVPCCGASIIVYCTWTTFFRNYSPSRIFTCMALAPIPWFTLQSESMATLSLVIAAAGTTCFDLNGDAVTRLEVFALYMRLSRNPGVPVGHQEIPATVQLRNLRQTRVHARIAVQRSLHIPMQYSTVISRLSVFWRRKPPSAPFARETGNQRNIKPLRSSDESLPTSADR